MKLKIALLVPAFCFLTHSALSADVEANWSKHCASCHAKDGSGNTKMGKKLEVRDYRDPKVQEAIKDDPAIKAIKEGVPDPKGGKERMKGYADKLSDEEVKALLAHIRAFKRK